MRYERRARTLDVVFRSSGEVYRYFGVPLSVWRAILRAPSKGTYLNTVFKEKGYGYEKVEGWISMVAAAGPREPPGNARIRDLPDENIWGFYE